jgi:hypothetical protein
MTKAYLLDELELLGNNLKNLLYYFDEMNINIDFYDSEGKPTPYKTSWDRVANRVLIDDIKNSQQKEVIKERINLKEKDFDKYFETISEFYDYWETLNT